MVRRAEGRLNICKVYIVICLFLVEMSLISLGNAPVTFIVSESIECENYIEIAYIIIWKYRFIYLQYQFC